jgi:hypothetical protein
MATPSEGPDSPSFHGLADGGAYPLTDDSDRGPPLPACDRGVLSAIHPHWSGAQPIDVKRRDRLEGLIHEYQRAA